MSTDQLSVVFSALADPTRRALLAQLRRGEATVTELAEPFAMSLPAISRHLKVLETAGLIERGRAAQWRPCRLRAGPLRDAAEWLVDYRVFWEESLDRLVHHLERAEDAQPATDANAKSSPEQPADPEPDADPGLAAEARPTTADDPRRKEN